MGRAHAVPAPADAAGAGLLQAAGGPHASGHGGGLGHVCGHAADLCGVCVCVCGGGGAARCGTYRLAPHARGCCTGPEDGWDPARVEAPCCQGRPCSIGWPCSGEHATIASGHARACGRVPPAPASTCARTTLPLLRPARARDGPTPLCCLALCACPCWLHVPAHRTPCPGQAACLSACLPGLLQAQLVSEGAPGWAGALQEVGSEGDVLDLETLVAQVGLVGRLLRCTDWVVGGWRPPVRDAHGLHACMYTGWYAAAAGIWVCTAHQPGGPPARDAAVGGPGRRVPATATVCPAWAPHTPHVVLASGF